MSVMNIAADGRLASNTYRAINKADLVWMLGLYGTAIGAGVLFLPINAGVGGLWPLVAMLILTTWAIATINPSILGMIEDLGGPIIAMLLFLMPMYAITKVPAMRKYAGNLSNGFETIISLIAMSGIIYKLIA